MSAPPKGDGAGRRAARRVLGPARTLVADASATGALATALGGCALLSDAVGRLARLALGGATGSPRELAAPAGPRPLATTRTTTRTAGHWALVARVYRGVIRAAVRRLR